MNAGTLLLTQKLKLTNDLSSEYRGKTCFDYAESRKSTILNERMNPQAYITEWSNNVPWRQTLNLHNYELHLET